MREKARQAAFNCEEYMKALLTSKNYITSPRSIVSTMATKKEFLLNKAFTKFGKQRGESERSRNSIMTLRALLVTRYLGVSIRNKRLDALYKKDVGDFCKKGFPATNICKPVNDLKNAFIKVNTGKAS